MPTDLITTGQVAEQLGVNRKTVQRMVRRGQLEPDQLTDLGPLFAQASVDAILAARPEPEAVSA